MSLKTPATENSQKNYTSTQKSPTKDPKDVKSNILSQGKVLLYPNSTGKQYLEVIEQVKNEVMSSKDFDREYHTVFDIQNPRYPKVEDPERPTLLADATPIEIEDYKFNLSIYKDELRDIKKRNEKILDNNVMSIGILETIMHKNLLTELRTDPEVKAGFETFDPVRVIRQLMVTKLLDIRAPTITPRDYLSIQDRFNKISMRGSKKENYSEGIFAYVNRFVDTRNTAIQATKQFTGDVAVESKPDVLVLYKFVESLNDYYTAYKADVNIKREDITKFKSVEDLAIRIAEWARDMLPAQTVNGVSAKKMYSVKTSKAEDKHKKQEKSPKHTCTHCVERGYEHKANHPSDECRYYLGEQAAKKVREAKAKSTGKTSSPKNA